MPEDEMLEILAIDAAVARSTGSDRYGITDAGFVPKSYSRVLAERFALAREVFGGDIDLTAGSVLRKLLEVTSLEDARTWAALTRAYDDSFVTSATGAALSRLGEELGLPRPHLEARGEVTLELAGDLPDGVTEVAVPRGARMLSPGGHHAWLTAAATLSASSPEAVVPAAAFHPGPDGDLDPADGGEVTLDRFHPDDDRLQPLRDLEAAAGEPLVTIVHDRPFVGGTSRWPDERYRRLLLRAPRSVWTADAIRIAASLVAGVRRVEVRDAWGGLDLHQSIFGNFNFAERLFGSERDIARPYYLTVLVGPTPGAVWNGPDGLHAAVASAIEDVRPVSIFPYIQQAQLVSVGVEADLVVDGLPLPPGSAARDAAPAAIELKRRIARRLTEHVDDAGFGEPVRAASVIRIIMEEPAVRDVRDLRLVRFPGDPDGATVAADPLPADVQQLACGANVHVGVDQLPVFVPDDARLRVV
ncbi:MAG: hypothetical protein KG028_01855 [Actinobacteria bacterium]|jgi:hypothetical protein|nr:hypothetical protein [Actinomycetota bacterium]